MFHLFGGKKTSSIPDNQEKESRPSKEEVISKREKLIEANELWVKPILSFDVLTAFEALTAFKKNNNLSKEELEKEINVHELFAISIISALEDAMLISTPSNDGSREIYYDDPLQAQIILEKTMREPPYVQIEEYLNKPIRMNPFQAINFKELEYKNAVVYDVPSINQVFQITGILGYISNVLDAAIYAYDPLNQNSFDLFRCCPDVIVVDTIDDLISNLSFVGSTSERHLFVFISESYHFINKRIQDCFLPLFLNHKDDCHFVFFSSCDKSLLRDNLLKDFCVYLSWNELATTVSRIIEKPISGNESTDSQTQSTLNNDKNLETTSEKGIAFEKYCAGLLQLNGFKKIVTTAVSGDHGADIIAEKDSLKYAIQCKNYTGQVGNSAVQEVYAAKTYYDCDIAVVMTNSTFTSQALDEATKLGVKLWDKTIISEMQPV